MSSFLQLFDIQMAIYRRGSLLTYFVAIMEIMRPLINHLTMMYNLFTVDKPDCGGYYLNSGTITSLGFTADTTGTSVLNCSYYLSVDLNKLVELNFFELNAVDYEISVSDYHKSFNM